MKQFLASLLVFVVVGCSEYSPAQAQSAYTPAGEIISQTCDGTTLKLRIADGLGGLTKEDTENSVECGGTGGFPGPGGGDTDGGTGGDGGGGTEPPPPGEYCQGVNTSLIECNPTENLDPWIASTGEKPYWVKDGKILAVPFTFYIDQGVRNYYQFFQFTTAQSKRTPENQDIFHAWFSLTPGGPLLDNNPSCEWWTGQARGYMYMTPNSVISDSAESMCLMDPKYNNRVMYANFETRCYPPRYQGVCDDSNKQNATTKYQFDVARGSRLVGTNWGPYETGSDGS